MEIKTIIQGANQLSYESMQFSDPDGAMFYLRIANLLDRCLKIEKKLKPNLAPATTTVTLDNEKEVAQGALLQGENK